MKKKITLRRGRWTKPKTFRFQLFKSLPPQRHKKRRRLTRYGLSRRTFPRPHYARGRPALTLTRQGLTYRRRLARPRRPRFQLHFIQVRRNFWVQFCRNYRSKVKFQRSTGHWFDGPKRKGLQALIRVVRWGFARLNQGINPLRKKTFIVFRLKNYHDRSIKWHKTINMLFDWVRGRRPHFKRILRLKVIYEVSRPHNGMRARKLRRV